MEFFDQLRDAGESSQQEQKQLSFQERIIKQLLRRAGVQLNVKAAKFAAKERYQSDDLSFQWFHDEYPTFPVRLMAQKMRYTQETRLGELYGRGQFKRLPWWQEYEKQAAVYGVNLANDRAALLFNLPYAKDAFLMVLHNQPTQAGLIVDAEYRQDEAWPRTTFPMGKTGIVAVLESFDSFLQTVGNEWIDNS